MRPKVAAAIITGTIARPSRPSVRFTALPAPAITNTPTRTKNIPRSSTTFLKNGSVSTRLISGGPRYMTKPVAMAAMSSSSPRRMRLEKPDEVRRVTFR